MVRNILLGVSLRLSIGTVFLIAGISKLPIHSEWVEIVMAYKILPLHLARLYALALPWLEITVGVCLVLGLFIRFFSLVSIPMIVSFIVGNAIALSNNNPGGCGCLGQLIMMGYKEALVIDALLLVAAVLIFLQRRHFMALDWPTRLFWSLWLRLRQGCRL